MQSISYYLLFHIIFIWRHQRKSLTHLQPQRHCEQYQLVQQSCLQAVKLLLGHTWHLNCPETMESFLDIAWVWSGKSVPGAKTFCKWIPLWLELVSHISFIQWTISSAVPMFHIQLWHVSGMVNLWSNNNYIINWIVQVFEDKHKDGIITEDCLLLNCKKKKRIPCCWGSVQ